jgi:hypothetical protein
MKLKYLLTTLLCALLVLAVPAWAQQPEHRTDASLRAEAAVQVSVSLLAPLAGEDRERIRVYLRHRDSAAVIEPDRQGTHKKLPPGLQKKLERGGELPPGWQKKLARGEVLGPDLRRHAHRLPEALHRDLRGYDASAELLLLEDRVVRVATGQGTVLDVIDIADILLR